MTDEQITQSRNFLRIRGPVMPLERAINAQRISRTKIFVSWMLVSVAEVMLDPFILGIVS